MCYEAAPLNILPHVMCATCWKAHGSSEYHYGKTPFRRGACDVCGEKISDEPDAEYYVVNKQVIERVLSDIDLSNSKRGGQP